MNTEVLNEECLKLVNEVSVFSKFVNSNDTNEKANERSRKDSLDKILAKYKEKVVLLVEKEQTTTTMLIPKTEEVDDDDEDEDDN